MTWEERLIWITWLCVTIYWFGFLWGGVAHFLNMLVYSVGRNYLFRN